MKNKKNGINFKIKFLFIYNHLLAECNILKKFSKIQSFYFPTVHNIPKLYEIWRQKSSPASNGFNVKSEAIRHYLMHYCTYTFKVLK